MTELQTVINSLNVFSGSRNDLLTIRDDIISSEVYLKWETASFDITLLTINNEKNELINVLNLFDVTCLNLAGDIPSPINSDTEEQKITKWQTAYKKYSYFVKLTFLYNFWFTYTIYNPPKLPFTYDEKLDDETDKTGEDAELIWELNTRELYISI